MDRDLLRACARDLVAQGRGILAADEDTDTIARRFATAGVRSDVETRRRYRQMLFTTPGLVRHISGVILFEETLEQRADDGRPLPKVLTDAGMIVGVTVDRGWVPLEGSPGELVTDGLDGIEERLLRGRRLGARFAKWRSALAIGDAIPTVRAIEANAQANARYAFLAQRAGLVPIVEPDVSMAGDHTIERCEEVTASALRAFYTALASEGVWLPGTLLKTNMILPGSDGRDHASVDQVASATSRCLRGAVPPEVPGIVLLSGGQGEIEATAHLDAIVRMGRQPWEVSFAFGRALQGPALRAWAGNDANAGDAQAALSHRARMCGLARSGAWSEMEEGATLR